MIILNFLNIDRIKPNKIWEIEFQDIWNIYINQNIVGISIFSKSDPSELNGMVIRSPTEADCEQVSCNGQTATWVDCRCPVPRLPVTWTQTHKRVGRNLDSRAVAAMQFDQEAQGRTTKTAIIFGYIAIRNIPTRPIPILPLIQGCRHQNFWLLYTVIIRLNFLIYSVINMWRQNGFQK